MPKFKQSLLTFAGLFALMGAIMLISPSPIYGQKASAQPSPVPPPQNVRVINSPSEPVPITGTVSVANIGSSPLPVRDVDNPARQPIQRFFIRFPSSPGPPDPYTVPEGKRLVIEYVSGEVTNSATCTAKAAGIFTTITNDGTQVGTAHRFPLTATTIPLVSVFGQVTRLYADPNTTVQPSFSGVDNTGNCVVPAFQLIFSGYFVDLPPPPPTPAP